MKNAVLDPNSMTPTHVKDGPAGLVPDGAA